MGWYDRMLCRLARRLQRLVRSSTEHQRGFRVDVTVSTQPEVSTEWGLTIEYGTPTDRRPFARVVGNPDQLDALIVQLLEARSWLGGEKLNGHP
jgi:hypothetical protein